MPRITKTNDWLPEWSDALLKMIEGRSGSYADYANRLNALFGTSYTRNATIGRAKRMGLCNPIQRSGPSLQAVKNARERDRLKKKRMREQRWAANPTLEQRYQRAQEKKGLCKFLHARGATKTSAVYRKHLPHQPEMTKNQLRAMLTNALQNTAEMVIA